MLVSVQSSVDDTTEEIIEDDSQGLGSHHAVQGSNKHSFLGIQPLGLTASIIRVGQHPGNDLNFLKLKRFNIMDLELITLLCMFKLFVILNSL